MIWIEIMMAMGVSSSMIFRNKCCSIANTTKNLSIIDFYLTGTIICT